MPLLTRNGDTSYVAYIFMKTESWANPFGFAIKQFKVTIVSHPDFYNNLTKSEAKHV
jgi:hypothetical protein